MEAKHTQGEWENRNGHIFLKGTYNKIADVCVQKNYKDVTFEPIEDVEADANAKLITEAPNLLKSLTDIVNSFAFAEITNEQYQLIVNANNAIRKVTK